MDAERCTRAIVLHRALHGRAVVALRYAWYCWDHSGAGGRDVCAVGVALELLDAVVEGGDGADRSASGGAVGGRGGTS